MSDKEKNTCGCGCGCEEDNNLELVKEENTCGCGDEDCGCEDEGCGCGHDHDHEHESFVVDLEDENGNVVSCEVIDAFEYKEKEYVLVQNPNDGSVYLFKSEGEEGELAIPDDEEFEEVTKYYESELAQ
ncbi:DUF1292 domain-containing protein [Clostridium manihotivorum]|uniref:DUF1292 domain-containing protein n=1 Tax=Clostridium manihotivorum TaxID=2320868 RepID=A0A3R5TK01_9CLOT|nr:DUF1292 domain-containing protein [Clostridium manihotivorum]QAA35248.1 DUF1292 domain-containing protein [Clostridium manihotivorum]